MVTLLAGLGGGCAEDLPVAEPDFVEADAGIDVRGGTELQGDAGVLIGPSYDLAVQRIAVGDSLGDVMHEPPEDLRAGDGREFVAVLVVAAPVSPALSQAAGPLAVDVVRGRRAVRVDEMPTDGQVFSLVVNVAEGADPELVVSDVGTTQALNLRTGRRTQEAEGSYVEVGQALEHTYVSPVVVGERQADGTTREVPAELSITLGRVSREPTSAAPATGSDPRVSLRVTYDGLTLTPAEGVGRSRCADGASIDADTAFAVVDDQGQEVSSPLPRIIGPPQAGLEGEMDFSVWRDFTSGTLRFTPAAARLHPDDCEWITPPVEDGIALQLTAAD